MTTESTVRNKPDNEVNRTERTRCGACYQPRVDIVERADELLVRVDMPGVPARNADVNFENGTLSIHGRVEERPGTRGRFLHREFGVGDFARTFQLSEAIDASRITAESRDGVLTLHLPKTASAMPRKIAVNGAQ